MLKELGTEGYIVEVLEDAVLDFQMEVNFVIGDIVNPMVTASGHN